MKKTLLIICTLLVYLISFAQTSITFDEYGNVELSQLAGFSDNAVVTINITVTNAENTDVGWGIGKITDIAYAKDNTDFQITLSAQAVSEEGSLNSYEFTVGEIKALASISPDDLEALKTASEKTFGTDCTVNENYIVDQYNRIGFVVNVWGAATRTGISVREVEELQPSDDIVFDFEADEIGATYPASEETTAEVVADPVNENEKSLSYQNTNYDQVITIGNVVLPEGQTLADLETISFKVYTESAEYKELLIKIGDSSLWGNGIYKKVSGGGQWGSVSINLNTGVTKDADGGESAKEGSKGETTVITDANKDLTSFVLAIGVNDNSVAYYLDNITLISKKTGIIPVSVNTISPVHNVEGGIFVNTNDKVTIYGIDGRLVNQTVANYNMISLKQGVYIVKVGTTQPVKVLVK
ncbi:MAG: hypothetical protein LBG15_12795 [Dysgonamonadaceae bacterium]|jgi:hypothetical protein|nr:hypothetical protein [Dysgonamonadaceae bacterium]